MRRVPWVGLGWGLAACSPPSTTQEEGRPAPRSVAPEAEEVACRDSPDQAAWARFDGAACHWELHDHGSTLALSSLAPDAGAPAKGEVPPPCRDRTCVYYGVFTSAGPLVLAVVPSFDSEMPSDVLLGVVQGERLAFASLWDGAGEPIQSDYTRVGPAHALAPFVCGETLALLAVERIDAAGATVPETLRAREGRIELRGSPGPSGSADAADPWTLVGPVERSGCEPVDLPVP